MGYAGDEFALEVLDAGDTDDAIEVLKVLHEVCRNVILFATDEIF